MEGMESPAPTFATTPMAVSLPAGSRIRVETTARGGRRFTWTYQRDWFTLGLWVCLLAPFLVVLVLTLVLVSFGRWGVQSGGPWDDAGLWIFLGIGGALALALCNWVCCPLLWSLPERVTLEGDRFRHDSGWAGPFRGHSTRLGIRSSPWNPFRPRRVVELSRGDLGAVATGWLSGRYRLWYHRGEEIIELGASLPSAERDWLADQIAQWQGETEACPASS